MLVRQSDQSTRLGLNVVLISYCLLCVIFGGAGREWFFAHGWLQAVAVIGIASLLTTWPENSSLRGTKIPVAILAVLIFWSIVQLIPLPPEIWVRLPGREILAVGYDELGLERPYLPISLDPDATLATMGYPLIPLFVLLLSIRIGRDRLEQTLPVLVCAIALTSASLGGAQLFLGRESELYLYAFTTRDLPVGVFSNINHQASLLLMSFPFLFYLTHRFYRDANISDKRVGVLIIGSLLTVSMILCVISARSIAGWVLLPIVLILSSFAFQKSNGAVKVSACLAIAGLGIVVGASSNFASIVNEVNQVDFLESDVSRFNIWNITWDAITDHWLFGSGIGTYESAIVLYEDPDLVTETWVAKAHNDYLQLIMEAGLVGVGLMFAGIYWFAVRLLFVWRENPSRSRILFGRMNSIALTIWALHSLVDYPGRTIAISVILALFVVSLGDFKPRVRPAKETPRSIEVENPKRLIL